MDQVYSTDIGRWNLGSNSDRELLGILRTFNWIPHTDYRLRHVRFHWTRRWRPSDRERLFYIERKDSLWPWQVRRESWRTAPNRRRINTGSIRQTNRSGGKHPLLWDLRQPWVLELKNHLMKKLTFTVAVNAYALSHSPVLAKTSIDHFSVFVNVC